MKQLKFFAVALAALTMFSCSKENTNDPAPLVGEAAEIRIQLLGEENSKAAAKPADDADKRVSDITVFLFKADGTLDVKKYFNAGTNPTITGTTKATEVFVVTNTGNLTGTGGVFAAVDTKAKMLTAIAKLTAAADGTGAATQISPKVYMSGNASVGAFTEEGGKMVAKPSVTLAFVGAKVTVTVDYTTSVAGGSTYGTDFTIDGAFMLNAAGASKFFPKSPATTMIPTEAEFVAAAVTPYFLNGEYNAAWTSISKLTTTPAPSLTTTFADVAAVTAGAHFYVFENDNGTIRPAVKLPTILALKATWKKAPKADGTPGVESRTIYFPVRFEAGDGTGTTPITRGNAYNVTVNLKGDFKEGGNGGGGTPDPGEVIKSADVTITITPATWTPKTVSKDFN